LNWSGGIGHLFIGICVCERERENIIMVSLVVKEMGFVVCVWEREGEYYYGFLGG
jgi:hypothetical protein